MTTLHAILGASSAHRWIPCPGSIRMSAGMPNESSVYAREGSAAHEIAAMALLQGKDALEFLGFELKEYPEVEVDEHMCNAVQEYLDAIWAEVDLYEMAGHDDWEMLVEQKFDLSHVYHDMFGTCDCILFFPAWKKLLVSDYKHGWTSVPVVRNPQTMYYAIGAITGKHNREVDKIELMIVQPRSGRNTIVKRWDCDIEELWDYRAVLVDSAKRTERKDSVLNPGEWCKFCPASPVCRALANRVKEIIMAKPDPIDGIRMPEPDKIPFDHLRTVWENASLIEGWIKNVKGYCHREALNKNYLPRTKLVEGRSIRKWRDEDEAKKRLEQLEMLGTINGEVYTPPELKSPAQIEDLMQKKDRVLLKGLVKKGKAALVLVDENDERDSAKPEAEKEFDI